MSVKKPIAKPKMTEQSASGLRGLITDIKQLEQPSKQLGEVKEVYAEINLGVDKNKTQRDNNKNQVKEVMEKRKQM